MTAATNAAILHPCVRHCGHPGFVVSDACVDQLAQEQRVGTAVDRLPDLTIHPRDGVIKNGGTGGRL